MPSVAVTAHAADPDPGTAQRLLAALPAWFGLPEANAHYIEAAERLPTYVAEAAGRRIGLTLIQRPFPGAAEVYLMAVDPAWHRRGAGRAMLAVAEADLAADGVRFLQVKTLSARHPDPGYTLTRAFYRGCGFTPLEEFPDLWPGNPCLQLVKALPRS